MILWGASALGQAQAGLKLSELKMKQLSADMIAKDLPGFTRTNQEASIEYINGEPYGINVGDAQEVTDSREENNLRLTAAKGKSAELAHAYTQQITDAFGQMGLGNSLAESANKVFKAIEAAHANGVNTPGNRKDVANSIKHHLQNINEIANKIQNVRSLAENDKANAINEINELLEQIAVVNRQISSAESNTNSSLGYMRQRRDLINKLGEYIPLQSPSSTGDFILQTASGRTVVHEGNAAKFLYTPQVAVTSSTTFDPIYLQTISTDSTANGTGAGEESVSIDVTDDFNNPNASGALAGITTFLQTTAESFSAYLDSYAAGFRDSMNEIHNLSSAITPSSSLVGTSGFIGGTTLTGAQQLDVSGVLRIAIVNNTSKNSTYSFDLNLSAIVPAAGGGTPVLVSDVVAAINSGGTLSTYLTASVNTTTNSLEITLKAPHTNTSGIALGSVSGQTAPTVTTDGNTKNYGFSEFFHLNDLVSASSTYYRDGNCKGLAQQVSLASLIGNDNNASALALVKLRDDIALGTTAQAVSSDPSVGRSLLDRFTRTDTSFPATGPNSSFNGTYEKYATRILQAIGNEGRAQKSEADAQKESYKQQSLVFSQNYGLSESEIATISLEIARSQDLYFNFINSYFRMMRNVAKIGTGG